MYGDPTEKKVLVAEGTKIETPKLRALNSDPPHKAATLKPETPNPEAKSYSHEIVSTVIAL